MKKTLFMFLLFMGIYPFGTIQLYSQDYLNIKYTTSPTYKYALISDISEITFNAGGTNMTVALTDASSTTADLSTVVEMTFDASILGGGSPLPVEFTSFYAETNEKAVTLYWTTATEVNNYGFEVQRKKEKGKSWEDIGFVEGAGNSNSPKQYTFIDKLSLNIRPNLKYRLKQIDTDGKFKYSDSITVEFKLPINYELKQNYPNPFNPTTKISYSLPKASDVTLKVYNTLGQVAAVLVNERQEAGSYNVTFNAENLPSGIYFYSIRTEENVSVKKMILLR